MSTCSSLPLIEAEADSPPGLTGDQIDGEREEGGKEGERKREIVGAIKKWRERPEERDMEKVKPSKQEKPG